MEGAWSLSDDANVPAPAAPNLEERLELELSAVRGYLRALAGRGASDADVDDLAQEVCARAWRSRASFDATRPLRPWLRATTLRVWIDHRREHARRSELETAHARESRESTEPVSSIEEQESLERMLDNLEPVERDVLLRFHRRGQSVREIAVTLGTPEGTIKSHLTRARKKLARRGRVDR